MIDIAIIGAGPAGMTASVYARRAGYSVTVFELGMPGGQLSTTDKIENFPGYPEGLPGAELGMKFYEHAQAFGAEFVFEQVVRVEADGAVKKVVTNNGTEEKEYEARAIIIATGAHPRTLFGTQSDDQIQETAQAEDITATITDDTVTYQMTPETQQELLLGFKTHFEEEVQSTIDSGDIPGLVHVDYNDTMSAFTVTVNRDNFQTQGGEAQLGLLYSAGTTYQLYAGTEEEAIDVTVTLVDQATQEEFDTTSMRQVFSEQQAPGDNAD